MWWAVWRTTGGGRGGDTPPSQCRTLWVLRKSRKALYKCNELLLLLLLLLSSENINAKCLFLGLAAKISSVVIFQDLFEKAEQTNFRGEFREKQGENDQALLTSVSSLALTEWKLFVRVNVIAALFHKKSFFLHDYTSVDKGSTEADTSLPVNVTPAFPQGTLTSSFHQSSGASWVLLTLSDLLKVTSGGFHLSSIPPEPFCYSHIWRAAVSDWIAQRKEVKFVLSCANGPWQLVC